jgi:hypothetical protein
MSDCPCCVCPIEESVKFKLTEASDWQDSIYCSLCAETIRQNVWSRYRETLCSLDCLAVLNSIRQNGLPMTLVERDISAKNGSWEPVYGLRYGDRDVSPYLTCDLTVEQRDSLVADLRALVPEETSPETLMTITQRYWPQAV